uniref:Protein FAR1-RELATED SEQUENCE n=1 Tax=Arundo donax TaxID=35708 RepID=A0A0A9DED4_ARUDO
MSADIGAEVPPNSDTVTAVAGAPAVGMVFSSPESAREFYCAYAARAGFRVRSSKSFTSRLDDAVIMRRFVCTRQGLPSRKDPPLDPSKKRRNRASARAGCPAMVQVNRRPGPAGATHWVVSRCVFHHSHPLGGDNSGAGGTESADTPDKRSDESSQPPSGQSGNGNAELSQRTSLGPGGSVAQSLLEHFKKKQAENPAFCYAVQLDRSNSVINFMWVDARARLLYRWWFGDAVALDLSCKRNSSSVPFVALTGLNHRRQVIVFGCALMTNESEDSFVWLFETWLAFMGGKKPVSFTIGYNRAVEMAAMKVFREVRHRFCRRDIFSNCKVWLAGVYAAHPSFKQELKECVNELERINEFESAWRLLLKKYNLLGNEWLQTIYSIRHQWVSVYLMDSFFGELLNAPKLETMLKFFRRNAITTTSLLDLVMQLDKAILGHYHNELQEDFAAFHSVMVMKTPYPMEKQASDLYSKLLFDLFQDELVGSSQFLVQKVETGHISKFEVTKSGIANRRYTVVYNEPGNRITCSCHKFEHGGILCRHALRVLIAIGMLVLPDKYILKRWTRNAKSDILSPVPRNSRGPLAWRCNDLCRDAIRFAEEGATSAEIYKIAKEVLHKAFTEILPQRKFP